MHNNSKLIESVKKSIIKYKMITPGDTIIAAVSGGPDSLCLADILSKLADGMNLSLVIAHYEHGLRPDEDSSETLLVKDFAGALNVPFETEKGAGLKDLSSSIEEKARECRYDFLDRLKIKYNADKIATGHNLNDQAETVLMRLLRGSGMTGLSGIPPVRNNTFIRPLIETRRENIMEYLEFNKISYATDSSNHDTRYLRNKIRLELIPELTKYQPRLIETMGRLAHNLREENEFIERQADEWAEKNTKQEKSGEYAVNTEILSKLPDAFLKRIIRNIIKRHSLNLYGIDSEHVDEIIGLITNTKPNASIDLPGSLIVRKEYNSLIFSSGTLEPAAFEYLVNGDGELPVCETNKIIKIETIENNMQQGFLSDPNIALLNGDMLPFPLTVRNFRKGDKFIPLGMKGHKKLKNFFIDLKIPPAVRRKTPVIIKDDKIVWVCGFRIDDRFKVTTATKTILKITLFGK